MMGKLMGFSLAVCFGADSVHDFCCDVKFEMEDGNQKIATVDCPTNNGISDHLWLSYVPFKFLDIDLKNCSGNIDFSFLCKTSVFKNWYFEPWGVRASPIDSLYVLFSLFQRVIPSFDNSNRLSKIKNENKEYGLAL